MPASSSPHAAPKEIKVQSASRGWRSCGFGRSAATGLCAGLDFSGEDPACTQQRFILMINATLENALARQTARYVIPVRTAGATMAIMSATGTAIAIIYDHLFLGPWHQKSGKDFMIDLRSEGTGCRRQHSSDSSAQAAVRLHPHPLPHVVRDDRPTDGPGTVNS